jgi:uncharacterized protein
MTKFLTGLKALNKFWQALVVACLSCLMAMGLTIAPAFATGVYDLPSIAPGEPVWIIDQADVISLANEGAIGNTLNNLAKNTGQEVRIVVIRRLDFDATIDGFADELFNSWFPTAEDKANQTLLVVDILTNKTAIRTGGAVKQILSDEIAKSVAEETVGIPLQEGSKYNQALLEGSDRLAMVLSGQPDPGPPQVREVTLEGTYASAEETDDRSATVWVVVLLIVATVIPMVTYFWYVGFPNNN